MDACSVKACNQRSFSEPVMPFSSVSQKNGPDSEVGKFFLVATSIGKNGSGLCCQADEPFVRHPGGEFDPLVLLEPREQSGGAESRLCHGMEDENHVHERRERGGDLG